MTTGNTPSYWKITGAVRTMSLQADLFVFSSHKLGGAICIKFPRLVDLNTVSSPHCVAR